MAGNVTPITTSGVEVITGVQVGDVDTTPSKVALAVSSYNLKDADGKTAFVNSVQAKETPGFNKAFNDALGIKKNTSVAYTSVELTSATIATPANLQGITAPKAGGDFMAAGDMRQRITGITVAQPGSDFVAAGSLNPTMDLQGISGTQPGSDFVAAGSFAQPNFTAYSNTSNDIRVRLCAQVGQESRVYGDDTPDNLMSIMHPKAHGTNGLLFPYTPTISVTQAVDYKEAGPLVHTNADIQAYSRTPSVTFSVTGKFTIQNQREGRYALAVLHFLRTVSKMYFGEQDKANGLAGLPPPVLVFNAYGNYMFNNLPVILKSHSYTLNDTVDMVDVQTAGGIARIPALFEISMDLAVQQSPSKLRKEFSLDAFRTGDLMRNNKSGWI
jgi:hypothetical protein